MLTASDKDNELDINGKIELLIGTHALFQKKIDFFVKLFG
jgi:RecG-like helicase